MLVRPHHRAGQLIAPWRRPCHVPSAVPGVSLHSTRRPIGRKSTGVINIGSISRGRHRIPLAGDNIRLLALKYRLMPDKVLGSLNSQPGKEEKAVPESAGKTKSIGCEYAPIVHRPLRCVTGRPGRTRAVAGNPGEFHPAVFTDPHMNLSIHTARAIVGEGCHLRAKKRGFLRSPVGHWLCAG